METIKKNKAIKRNTGTTSVANTVYKTTEYDLFVKMLANRDLRNYHVTNLKKSHSEKQIEIPITVNELYQIIDGQHRFEACKGLGLPVYYIVIPGLGLDDVQRLNSYSKNWSLAERCKSFCDRGFKEYLKYREFKNEFKFNDNETIAMLEGTSNSKQTRTLWAKFTDGKFKVKDLPMAMENAQKIIAVGKYYDGNKRRSFVFALLVCFEHKSYDHDVFLKKLSKQSAKLTDQVHEEDYLRIIQKIYNRRNTNPISLFF